MSRPVFNSIKLFIFIFIVHVLTACGGGSDEPSNLLLGTGQSTDGGSTTPPDTSQSSKDVTVSIGHDIMLPAGGNTDVFIITYEKDDTKTIDNLPIVPDATFNVTVVSPAVINGSHTSLDLKTDHRGQASFNISHPGSGVALINVRGTGRYKGGFSSGMYFGGSVTSAVVLTDPTNPVIPADGTSSAHIKVFVRDWAGRGISGIPVDLSFSLNSFAVAVPPNTAGTSSTTSGTSTEQSFSNITDDNGEFVIGITNKVAQTIKVTPIAGGMASAPLSLTFGAASVVTTPISLELIIKQNNVRPDGQSEASLIAIARDEAGVPIPYIPVKLTSNSATAVLKIGEVKSNFFIQGNTGSSGTLEINLTNTVEEDVTITASTNIGTSETTDKDKKTLNAQQTITFVKDETTSGIPVGKIELDQPINNNQLANGTDVVNLRGRVLDSAGNPIPNINVSLILSGGSAQIKDMKEETDSSGRFFASLTDEVVEEFKVKAVLGEISSNEVTVKFVAIPPPEGETLPIPPQSITLIAIPNQQMVDDGSGKSFIKLTASVRDSNNTPMAGVKVSISTKSSTALFDVGQQTTDDGGTAVFQMSNSVAESVTVTASAWVEDAEKRLVGTAVNTSKTVLFTNTPTTETIPVSKLFVTVVNNKQPASAETPIQIDVVARDNKGLAVKEAPIMVLMAGAKAVARPALGKTDENGYFSTQITSTEAGKVNVTIAVENTSIAEPLSIEFIAQPGELAKPKQVDLEIINDAQPADGTSRITLLVIPRDAQGSPLAGVEIQLISDSINAELVNDKGTTDALGEFRTTVTSKVPETFSITPVGAGTVIGTKKSVTFTQIGSGVAELIINVLKDNQPATGKDEDAIQINVIARDAQGRALSNVPIHVQLQKGSIAVAKAEQKVTDENGLFTAKLISTSPGTVAVTISAEGTPLVYPPVVVTFITAPGVTKPTTIETRVVGTLSQVADGKAQIILVVTPKNGNNPMPGIDVDLISDSNTAVIDPKPPQKTNALGEVRFAISDTVAHAVTVTPVAEGFNGTPTTLTFTPLGGNVTDLVVTPLNDEVPANGKDTIDINVVARDAQGQTVPNIPIVVQLPQKDSAAVVSPFSGTTDAQTGVFSTKITSSIAGEVPINFSIENTTIARQVIVKFVPAKQTITPTTVEIVEVRNAPQSADEKSEITLKVIPRSPTGEPIPDINIELVSDPQPEKLVIKDPTGKSNALGEYQTTVTSGVAGTFNITPVAWKEGGEKITGKPTAITFTPIGVQVADLTVTVVGDKKPATGKEEDAIQLDVVVRDSGGRPVAGVPIVVQLPTGTVAVAKSASEGDITNASGLFSTKITSTKAGKVVVTVAIKDTSIVHPPIDITFVEPAGTTPTTVELLVFNAPQPADDKSQVILEVTTTDAKGTAIAGVKIELIHDSSTAKLDKATGETNALGKFRTTVTNTVAETFKVTPIAAGGTIIGNPVQVTFIPIAIPIPATLTLTVEYEEGEEGRQVGKQATLTVFTYDENRAPLNGVPVTFSIQPGNEASDLSYTTVKFDPGANGSTGNEDGKGGNGTFATKVSNSQQGTFKVVAKVTGTSLSSNVIEVSFNAAKTTTPDIKEIDLIADYPQLGSDNKNAGGSEGVIITAILKDKDNNLVKGASVRFSSDSGEIQPIEITGSNTAAGITDASGRAQARLTTKGSRHNRVITVTARVSTPTGDKTATIPVKIMGTNIRVAGGNSLILGGSVDLTLTLVDAGNLAISGEALSVDSSLGNPLNNPSPVTNASGQAIVTLTGKVAGDDVITVTLANDKEGAIQGTHTVTISDHEFSIVSIPENAEIRKIPLNTPQQFVIRWKKGGTPQALQQISLSTTRGELPATVTTDINGEAPFTVVSKTAGPSQLKATTNIPGGPSAQIDINFIASSVASMTLQADPSTIGVNTPGAGQDAVLQQSKVTAVLRDSNNNLVEGKTVSFNLIDNTGGDLSPISTITDKFGQASTTYTAGGSSSAGEGVSVIAMVEGESGIQCAGSEKVGNGCAVKLTVALKRVFISLGTGNKVTVQDDVTYQYPYKALATDINGAPIPDTEIVISAVALGYLKGYYTPGAAKEGATPGWAVLVTAPKSSDYCENEDRNNNGLLDPEEDRNQNGRLEPGGVVTFAADQGSVVKDNTVKVKTGRDGYAVFNISYYKEMSNWVVVKVTARSSVSGSEDTASLVTALTGLSDDFKDATIAPPARHYANGLWGSPFGLGPVEIKSDATDPTKTTIDASKAACEAKE